MKRLLLLIILFICLLLTPIILWFLDDPETLEVAIIDKTVPNETYREHLGISWILNHYRYTKKDGSQYNPSVDYKGFFPNEKEKNYKIKPLLNNYKDKDVIYIADTYGVYKEDLSWIKKDREGTRSSLIYGGLKMEEWNAITDRLKEKKRSTLIVEFNSIASPTKEEVRKSMSEYLQLDWTGWTGRYFEELDYRKNEEIPQWIVEKYGEVWKYNGSGFLLINNNNDEIVVLEENKHVLSDGMTLSFTKKGQKEFNLKKSSKYNYWFDIVTPKDNEDVIAEYNWNLTKSGEKILEKNGIPKKFAAVIESVMNNSKAYYFAGDFNDIAKTPSFYQAKGISKLHKVMNTYSDESFYWDTYVPMMEKILSNSKNNLIETQINSSEISYKAKVEDDSFYVKIDEKWKKLTIKGVNLGMGKPGVFPGEAAITEEEYYRWIKQIGEMGANTIRVYTIHPPGFYNALKRYNEEHRSKPIYVLHGVWINEEALVDTLDAFNKENTNEFQTEMERIVDIIHGKAIIDPRPGHASGIYKADISQYVIGWVIGIEWYPKMVVNTNELHNDMGDYNGDYFKTVKASPFENWLAQQLDHIVTYEKDHYNWIRPASFTNWVTTDLLEHPAEPSEDEDIVSVDPNHIYTKKDMKKTNQFASYHVYPYYPDFMNYEEKYKKYKDFRGKYNNYAAYLSELHKAHKMPILIAEFGVPSSRGLTHENTFGMNQGFLSEQEQGEILVNLYEDIMHEGLLGGLIFTWQDEWFKRTWNTMDYDDPNRRPFWSNAQTNEQQFGLLSFDRNKIKVDGNGTDWENNTILYKKDSGILEEFAMDYDERYLYFKVKMSNSKKGYPKILLDTIPNQGNRYSKKIRNVKFTDGIDFLLDINGKKNSRVLVDSYYNFYMYMYGHQLKLIEANPKNPINNSGEFQTIQFALNKELYIPSIKEKIPFSSYETGKLRYGNANPNAANYDSLADYYINDKNGTYEIRIPWLMLNIKDPSHKKIMGNLAKNGISSEEIINGIKAGILIIQEDGKVIDSFPKMKNNKLEEMKSFSWEKWDVPKYEERLKKSYDIVKKVFTSQK